MLHHGVANYQFSFGRNRQQVEVEVTAVKHKGVIALAMTGDELVHDAAPHSHELVFCPLAEERELNAIERQVVARENSYSQSNFYGSRRAETCAYRNVASDQYVRTLDWLTRALNLLEHADRVV
jgi:hypothetical protein